uniref:MORN repeat containing protein n=1 Tax=Marseillevirus sp. TaxID=2809551 RepID=A0AA96EP77_9VIRU|nr:MORN repeat containing protein [Marseillevirus sp.]
MEEFLEKRESLTFAIASQSVPRKERFLKFYRSKHREFWLLPNKKKHGPEKIFHGGITTSERTWKDGFLHGEETNFTYSGKMYEMRTWRNGVRHGKTVRLQSDSISTNWWEDGKLVHGSCFSNDGEFMHALRWGTLFSYRSDGNISRIYSKGIFWKFSAEGHVKRYLSCDS